jgi:PAS domain S-box-containing protein
LTVALAYYATGRLGLELAIPPGYATAIWPPSGIALAAVLLWGRGVWPGIALGSFAINVATGFSASTSWALLESLGVPAAIAAGATLQAVLGAALVRRFVGLPNDFSDVVSVAGLLALGGVAGCLVNATIAVSTLYITGRVLAANVPFSWATWWAGDTIGVFVFAPLMLAWLSRPRQEWRKRWLAMTIGLGATFTLTVALVTYTASLERAAFASEFDDRTGPLAVELEKATAVYAGAVGAIEGLLAVSAAPSRSEFREFAARLYARVPGVQALEWAPRVSSTDRGTFEASMQAEGSAGFAVREQRDGSLQGAGERPEYFPIAFVEPLAGNELALGFDLASHPGRLAAMTAAHDSGEVSFTERVSLVQGGQNRDGFLAFMPVYGNSQPHGSVEQRRSSLAGFVLGVFRLADLMATAFRGHDLAGVNLWLIDETDPANSVVIYANNAQAPSAFESSERGLFGGTSVIGNRFRLAIGGRRWILETAPTQDFIAQHRIQNAWTVLFVGLLFTSLVGAFMMVLTGRERVLRLLFDDSPQPMWVYDRETLRFVDVNQTAVAKYGYSRAEFAKMRITDIRPPEEVPRLLELIHKLPHVYRSSTEWRHRRRDGSVIDVDIASHNVTLSGRAATLVVANDVSETKKAREALVESEQLARGIIGTALDAFVQMDETGKIVQWNAQAEAIFGWSSAEASGSPSPR